MSNIKNICIVLVGTSHPGNIGATARAMKTMGFSRLRLVNPKVFPSADATVRAAGADDILESASVYSGLKDALHDCEIVYGSSARIRNIRLPVLSPAETACEVMERSRAESRIALVFGRESSGLTNEELDSCNKMILIPTAGSFSSLNLAAAVQLVCYELFRKYSEGIDGQSEEELLLPVSNKEMNMLYEHLEECLSELGFLDKENPRKLMRRLKKLFNRALLDQNEYNIIRGILTAVQEKIRKK